MEEWNTGTFIQMPPVIQPNTPVLQYSITPVGKIETVQGLTRLKSRQ
jgi:hypothetical protein